MYQEIILTLTTKRSDRIEWLAYLLVEFGAEGVQVKYAEDYMTNTDNLFGEIPQDLSPDLLDHPCQLIGSYYGQTDKKTLQDYLLAEASWIQSIQVEDRTEKNWQAGWLDFYDLQRMSRYVLVKPVWQSYEPQPGETVLALDPGLAFGTGAHETTKLVAQLLEIYMQVEDRVLDVGCGSGILSLIAGALGASQVLGTDLDPQAVAAARNNLALQEDDRLKDRIQFIQADLVEGVSGRYDLVVANILPHILAGLYEPVKDLLTREGYLILGGILRDKGPEVEAQIAGTGFKILQTNSLGDWLAYILVREA